LILISTEITASV